MSNSVFRFATVQGQNIHWFLKRNCSVTPAQLGWLYVSLCAVTLSIGTFFWFQGAVLILPFAWLELAAVGLAFFAYARHAADHEHITLQGRRLVVETENAGRLDRAEFNRDWSEFQNRNAIVLGASTDTQYVHLAWRNSHPDLKDLRFPMLADNKKELSEALGILHPTEKVALRATYIVDPDGIVRWVSVGFIEFVRGVPLISVLFMANVMLPLFLPEGMQVNILLRVLVGVIMFSSALKVAFASGKMMSLPPERPLPK